MINGLDKFVDDVKIMNVVAKKINYYLSEKKFGTMDLKSLYQVLKKAVLYLVLVYIPFAVVATITNHLVAKDDQYAAILLSGFAFSDYDYWASPVAFLGSYPAWTFYFNLKGLRTDYFFSATKQDLKKVLIDSKYQSIVLVGHGSFNAWRATDQIVSNEDIRRWKSLFSLKTGEWIQLSCPGADSYPTHIGELIMENGGHSSARSRNAAAKRHWYSGLHMQRLDYMRFDSKDAWLDVALKMSPL